VILLSDIDGFYLTGKNAPEKRIETITDEIEAAATIDLFHKSDSGCHFDRSEERTEQRNLWFCA